LKRRLHTIFGIIIFSVLLTVAANAEISVRVGIVDVSAINFRAEPSTDARILASVSQNETVLIIDDTERILPNGWVRVKHRYIEGYMAVRYLRVETSRDVNLGPGRVTGSVVNVRSGAGTGYSMRFQLMENAAVTVTGVHDGWFKINFGTREGYIHPGFLTLVKPTVAAAPASGNSSSSNNNSTGSSVAAAVPPSADGLSSGAKVVEKARQYLGVRYVYGGSSPNGFDCSGFTHYVYRQMGRTIGRGATSQLNNGTQVARGDLIPGDLVFFRDTNRVRSGASHVGIYVGGNQFIHSPRPGRSVSIETMASGYYNRWYLTARRIFT
jgi:cell wall-associated NlpC family hydrolase